MVISWGAPLNPKEKSETSALFTSSLPIANYDMKRKAGLLTTSQIGFAISHKHLGEISKERRLAMFSVVVALRPALYTLQLSYYATYFAPCNLQHRHLRSANLNLRSALSTTKNSTTAFCDSHLLARQSSLKGGSPDPPNFVSSLICP